MKIIREQVNQTICEKSQIFCPTFNTVNTLQVKEKNRKKIGRQPSLEEDALFIRKTIQEIERGSSRFKFDENDKPDDYNVPSTSKISDQRGSKSSLRDIYENKCVEDWDDKKKDEKGNGKKKVKTRARLEREQSKPSESDSEHDVDTVTVEIPRRRKRPRRASEKPRTPPASLHSDSEEEVSFYKMDYTRIFLFIKE